MEGVDKFAPLTKAKIQHKSNDWTTNESKNAITKRYKLFNLWVQSPSDVNKDLYERQMKVVTSLIWNVKQDSFYKKNSKKPLQ